VITDQTNLETFGRVVFGRGFEAQIGQPENAVILSESAAQLLWSGQNPIGHSLRLAPGGSST
jgi:hypothetical protein